MSERCRVLVFCIIGLSLYFVLVRILFSVRKRASPRDLSKNLRHRFVFSYDNTSGIFLS